MKTKLLIVKYRILLSLAAGIFIMLFFEAKLQAQNCTVNAGVVDSICPNQTMQLHGSSAGIYIGTGNIHWTQKSGPSVWIVNPYDMNTIIIGHTAGNTYEFYLWAKCEDGSLVKDSVPIKVFPLTTAQAGDDQSSCPGPSHILTLDGNEPDTGSGESGLWQVVGANNGITIANATLYNTTITLNPASCGVTVLRWTIRGSNSCSTYDDVQITNWGGVESVSAGSDQTLGGCYSTTYSATLNASNGGCGLNGQGGHWTVVSGPNIPNLSNANSASSGISNLIEGTYILRWDVTGPCASGSDFVTIVVPKALGGVTGASAGGSQVFCDGRTTFTLTGNNPLNANEIVTWSGGAPDAVIDFPNNPITTVSVPSGSTGIYTFSYNVRNTVTGCSSNASTSVTFNESPFIFLDAIPYLPCNDSTATIDYAVIGDGTVQWSIIDGPANWRYPTFPTAYTNATTSPQLIYNLSGAGTYMIRFRVMPGTGSGCVTATEDVFITTSRSPQGSNSGTPQLLACNVNATHLAGNEAYRGTGEWTVYRWPGEPNYPTDIPPGYPPTIADPTLHNTLISDLYPGIYGFQWLITNGSECPPSASATRVIVAYDELLVADAGHDQTVCYGAPLMLHGNFPTLNEWGSWSVVPAGPTFSDPANAHAIVNNLALNTLYTFTWTILNVCDTTSDDVQIQTTFDLGPVRADAGPDQCQPITTTEVTLHGNDARPGTGTWTQIPDANPPVIITNPADSVTTVTGMTPGTYRFEWVHSRNGCMSIPDTVTITISGPVTPSSAGADRNFCGTNATLAANAANPANVGEIGTWTQTVGNAGPFFDDIHSPTTNVGPLTTGYYQFNWTITNGACSVNSDSVILRVSVPPSLAVAGPDQTICGANAVDLAADVITAGTGSWSVSGPNSPSFSSYTDALAHVSGLITGIYSFTWTVTGGPYCPNSTDYVQITVYAGANAGTDKSYCDATLVELTGDIGSVGEWTFVSGTTTPTITPTVPASNKATAAPLVTGTYSFTYTVSYPGGCTSSDDLLITISGQPTTANAGPEQFLCKDVAPYTIHFAANTPDPGHGTGQWSRIWPVVDPDPLAAFSDVSAPSGTYTTTTSGLFIFKWTITDGTCTSSSEVRVNLYDPPTPSDAGGDQEVCGTQTTMEANLPTAGIGSWTQVSGPNAAVFTSTILPNTTVTGLIEGTYEFRWTIKNGTVCDSSTSTVNVVVHTNPGTPHAGLDKEFCETTLTYKLAGNTISPGTGRWYQSSADPIQTVTFSDPASSTATATFTVSETYHLIWEASNPYSGGSCILTDTVVITINQSPSTANAGVDFTKCRFAPVTMNATAPTAGVGTWTVNPGSTGPGPITFLSPHSPTSQV